MSSVWTYDTVIFASTRGGLCNRLRALVGYDALSRVRDCPFHLQWKPDLACDAAFLDLFESSSVSLVTDAEARRLSRSKGTRTYTEAKWFHAIWHDYARDVPWLDFLGAVRASLEELTPTRGIRDAAEAFSRTHDLQRALGVHIRHTDNVALHARQQFTNPRLQPHKLSTIDGFLDAIRTHIDKMPIFLATDNAGLERTCRERFGDALITYPKTFVYDWHPRDATDRTIAARRTTAVADALIELLLLAKCQRILGTYFSSFSKFAALWGEVDYVEMSGHEIQPSDYMNATLEALRSLDT